MQESKIERQITFNKEHPKTGILYSRPQHFLDAIFAEFYLGDIVVVTVVRRYYIFFWNFFHQQIKVDSCWSICILSRIENDEKRALDVHRLAKEYIECNWDLLNTVYKYTYIITRGPRGPSLQRNYLRFFKSSWFCYCFWVNWRKMRASFNLLRFFELNFPNMVTFLNFRNNNIN